MKNESKFTTQKLVTLAMLSAIAFVLTALLHFPLVADAPFLKYDPKDFVLAIIGFIYGPVEVLMSAVVVCLIEMVTVSDSGPIGLLMNLLSSCAFALPACLLYRKSRNMKKAVIGLGLSVVCVTASMILWNYLVTPLYTGTPREAVAGMLIPIFLPFNMIKSCINSVITLLFYKPVVVALRKSGLVHERIRTAQTKEESGETTKGKFKPSVVMFAGVAIFLVVIAVFYLFFLK